MLCRALPNSGILQKSQLDLNFTQWNFCFLTNFNSVTHTSGRWILLLWLSEGVNLAYKMRHFTVELKGEWNLSPQYLSLWHKDYFKLLIIEKL